MNDPDSLYHRLFSHPLMVEHLVGAFVPVVVAAGLDLAAIERVNAKFHGHRGKRREGDVIWRLPFQGGGEMYLYLLLEFQSQNDWWMAVRTQVYEGLLWQQLIAERSLRTGDRLPPVLLLVLYNGAARWKAPTRTADLIALPAHSPLWPWQPRVRYHLLDMRAFPESALGGGSLAELLVRLEQPQADPEHLAALIDEVIVWFRGHPDYGTLKMLFTELVRQAIGSLDPPVALPDDMQEMRAMVASNTQEWFRKWKAEGLAEGRAEGRAEGERKGKADTLLRQLRRRFGAVPAETETLVRAADGARLDGWCDRILDARTLDEVFGGDQSH